MRNMWIGVSVVLALGAASAAAQEKRLPVEPDKAGIEYLRDVYDNVVIALRPQTPMDVDVQVQGDEVLVVGWMRVREKRKENTCFTITLKNPRSVTITGVRMKATDAQKKCFTDPFGFRYILLSGPSLREKSPQEQWLVGTIEWREGWGSLITFMEPAVGQLPVMRGWMRSPIPNKLWVFGQLMVGAVAIGGETTGYVVTTAKGQAWDLDLHGDGDLISRAKKCNRQVVQVFGTPEFRKYVERGVVPTIRVDILDDLIDHPPSIPKKKS